MTLQTNNNNLDITKLAYEKINHKYSKAKYGEFDVIMDMTTGYINATKLCTDGGRNMYKWLENKSNKELVEYYKSQSTEFGGLTYTIKGGNLPYITGTYVHPKLITHIASWVSPSFAWKVSEIVNNHLIREKEIENIRLIGENIDLKKMFEDERLERRHAEQRAEQMLLKMTLQNEKTHIKLDKTEKTLEKAENDNSKIKTTLKRVETRIDKIVDEIVPPAKQVSLHEQFGIMKLNDSSGNKHYKVYCTQKRGVDKAKNSIIKAYPKAVLFKEVSPNANSKNFLHILKEKYGGNNKKSKIQVCYNFVNLKDGVSEEELNGMVNEVVENAKNYGNEV